MSSKSIILEPVVILANGDFPAHPIPMQKLSESGCIICCDGATDHLINNGMKPYVIIGDLDSIDSTLKPKYADRIIHLPDQGENDLMKAIRWTEDNGIEEATILGATGKRDDHSLANIFILLQFPTSLKFTFITNHGVFSTVENRVEFQSFKGQQVSLFSADPQIEITSNNLKYNLSCSNLANLYCSSLNESNGETFSLSISHGKILIYQVFA